MKEHVRLRSKTCSYLIYDKNENKKQKVQKMCNKKKA